MFKDIWTNFSRYTNISSIESKLALLFGIIGAFLETFSIYLLANLITLLSYQKRIETIAFLKLGYISINYYIIIFIISAIFAAYFYYLSNKNIVKAKCLIERFVRQEITDLTLNIKWEYYLKISQGDISKSIISEGQNISEGYMYFLSAITYSIIAFTYFVACLILVPNTFFILIYMTFLPIEFIFFIRENQTYMVKTYQI